MSEQKETDLAKVKELIELMIENDLIEIEVADGKNKIALKRAGAYAPVITHAQAATVQAAAAAAPAGKQDDGLAEIVSPMVGTFYSAPSPDSSPFVSVGDKVSPDTVVCIIEAMKVMNEIKAETSGTITEVLCKPGQALEFGQPLFKISPS